MREFKSLFKDTNYHNNPKGTWQHAKNLLLTKQFNSPVNENGSKYSHKFKERCVGIVDTNKEVVYFLKNEDTATINDYNSEIIVYNLETNSINYFIKGNFNFNRPIEGIFFYNFKEELIVAFSDGVFENSNTPKIINLSDNNLPLSSIGKLNDEFIPLIELFPPITKGIITTKRIEGNVEASAVYVTFKYCYKNVQETVYKDVNNFVYLEVAKPFFYYNNRLNSGFSIKLSELQNNIYDSVKIGLFVIKDGSEQAYESNNFYINNSEETINITSLSNFKTIANEELVIPKERFDKVESLTGHKNSLLLGKCVKNNTFKFQKYANLLELRFKKKTEDNKEKSNDYHLQSDEVYNFFIQLDLKNGHTTEWFKISNNIQNGASFLNIKQLRNTTNFQDKYFTVENNINGFESQGNDFESDLEKENYKRFHVENDAFYDEDNEEYIAGIWHNENIKYPNNDEYNSTVDYEGNTLFGGIDLRNEGLRFHRMPHNVTINECYIANLQAIVPQHILNQIENYRIGFTKRDLNNSLIITNPLMINSYYYDDYNTQDFNQDIAGLDFENLTPFQHRDLDGQNWRFGAPGSTHPVISMKKSLLLNPDLEIIKPKLNINFLICNSVFLGRENLILFSNLSNSDAYLKNKYFYKKDISYNYKLPNNSAQGSAFLDGGLFIDTQFDYMPVYNGVKPSDSYFNKFFNVDNTNVIRSIIANVLLCNLKKDLYEINSDFIVSSFNTIKFKEEDIIGKPVYIGDVSFTVNLGNLKYKSSNGYKKFNLESLIRVSRDNIREDIKINSFFRNTKILAKINKYNYSSNGIGFNDIETLNTLDYGYETNETDASNKINDLASYEAFNVFSNYLNRFPFRIYRSVIFGNEAFILNSLRKFLFNNYYELPNNKGDLVSIKSNDYNLYIQMRFELLTAKVKDVITSKEGENYLTEGDIFDRTPTPQTLDNKGYIGCEHKFSCKIFKEGHLSIDHQKGNIILTGESPKLISNESIRNWLMDNLKFEEEFREIVNGDSIAIDNPFNFIGFAVGYDNRYRRIFITKLYPSTSNYNSEEIKENYYNLLGDSEIIYNNLFNVPKDSIKSFTLSYSLDTQNWLCYHDFIPNFYYTINNVLYALKNVKLASDRYNYTIIHTMFNGFKGLYFGINYKSYIDIIFNSQPDVSKNYEAIEFITRTIKDNGIVQQSTIDAIAVFNDHQCSGIIDFKKDNIVLARKKEGSWRFNKFRDLVKENFSDFPIVNERGEINEEILDFNKNWFDKSYFISKFIVVRLIWNNNNNNSIFLNEVTMQASQSFI